MIIAVTITVTVRIMAAGAIQGFPTHTVSPFRTCLLEVNESTTAKK
jgi:hypothetical protein